MKRRLFGKYTLSVGFVVLISLTVMFLILTVVCNNYISRTKHENLKKTCDNLADIIEDQHSASENAEFNIYRDARNYADFSESNVYILDQNGVITVCSCDEWGVDGICEHSGSQIAIDEIIKISQSDRHAFSDLGIYKELQFVAATKIGGSDSGYVVAATSTTAIKTLVISVVRIYVFAIVIPLLIMLLECCLYQAV